MRLLKDLAQSVETGVPLGWRIASASVYPALFLGICYCGFQIALASGVTL